MVAVPFSAYPLPPHDPTLDRVASALDPILGALGFAPGQLGSAGRHAQVIFCRGDVDSIDGACVDLVVELEASPEWHVTDVRYGGFPAERWHLSFDAGADLSAQLAGLARTLPDELT